jgi:hypothetical protein
MQEFGLGGNSRLGGAQDVKFVNSNLRAKLLYSGLLRHGGTWVRCDSVLSQHPCRKNEVKPSTGKIAAKSILKMGNFGWHGHPVVLC